LVVAVVVTELLDLLVLVALAVVLDNQAVDLLVVDRLRLLAKVTLVVAMVDSLTIHTLVVEVVALVPQVATQLQIHNQVVVETEYLHIVLGEQQQQLVKTFQEHVGLLAVAVVV
jgi:hypothetical protein